MTALAIDNVRVYPGNGGREAPVIYLVNSPDHPFDVEPLAGTLACAVASLPYANWSDALTPWPAPGLYREEPDFGGHAADTLAELVDEAVPTIEKNASLHPARRAICGYSLGGLFALFALTHADAFDACACLSGSVWYEGWVDHLRSLDLDLAGRFAYLSVGTKEKRGGRPIMRTVQDNMEACAGILRDRGAQVTYVTGPGNHMQHIAERHEAGLSALDAFLTS